MAQMRVERQFSASPERLWEALTGPEALAAWMWPGAWGTTAEVDLRPGGAYRIASESMGMAVSGEYVTVDPQRHLVQTWRWDGDDHETLVTITVSTTDTGSLLTIVHERFGTDDDAADHLQGWNDCLDRLPAYLS